MDLVALKRLERFISRRSTDDIGCKVRLFLNGRVGFQREKVLALRGQRGGVKVGVNLGSQA